MSDYQEKAGIGIREASEADIPGVIALYHDAGWSNYTSRPAMLATALRRSLTLLVASDMGEIVGMIRAVGDGVSILYIQDIIVRQNHRRRGIGTRLLQAMDALYPNVYQKVLLTDDQPASRAFYESCGFAGCGTRNCHSHDENRHIRAYCSTIRPIACSARQTLQETDKTPKMLVFGGILCYTHPALDAIHWN